MRSSWLRLRADIVLRKVGSVSNFCLFFVGLEVGVLDEHLLYSNHYNGAGDKKWIIEIIKTFKKVRPFQPGPHLSALILPAAPNGIAPLLITARS
jgi:hypothetical protein